MRWPCFSAKGRAAHDEKRGAHGFDQIRKHKPPLLEQAQTFGKLRVLCGDAGVATAGGTGYRRTGPGQERPAIVVPHLSAQRIVRQRLKWNPSGPMV